MRNPERSSSVSIPVTYTVPRLRPYSILPLLMAALCVAFLCGCGGNASNLSSILPPAAGGSNGNGGNGSNSGGSGTSPTPPAGVQHVVVVVEENHSYAEVIGNAQMPYLNGLASKYASATNYFADTHPSLPNYFMLTTGSLVTLSDSYAGPYSGDNIAGVLAAAGKTWKVYAESLPSVGYTGGDKYPYIKHHNPFAYFSSVLNDPAQTQNIVPFSDFQADLSAGSLPSYSFVIPNLLDDAHDGSLAQADSWLQTNINPLVTNGVFANTLLVIVFDESETFDIAHGGGHVAAVIAGGAVKAGYQSPTLYQHESTLRLTLNALGIANAPGNGANATPMNDFAK